MRVLHFLTLALVAFAAVNNVNADAVKMQLSSSSSSSSSFVNEAASNSNSSALATGADMTTMSVKCNACQEVLKVFGGKILKKGCGVIARIALGVECEVLGGGPEDPLADVCAGAILGACSVVKSALNSRVDYASICQRIGLCGDGCHQCAINFVTPNQACVREAADWMQNNWYRGDDGYNIESSGPSGGWVRYWRVGTAQSCSSGDGKSGTCSGGGRWSARNPQQTGQVHCNHQ